MMNLSQSMGKRANFLNVIICHYSSYGKYGKWFLVKPLLTLFQPFKNKLASPHRLFSSFQPMNLCRFYSVNIKRSINNFNCISHSCRKFSSQNIVKQKGFLLASPVENKHSSINIMTKIRPSLYWISPRNYSDKGSGFNNIPSHVSSLKSKKRSQRKKMKVDEPGEQDAEGFQIERHHRFLTFDPDFAFPHIIEHKPPTRDFQIAAYGTADEYNLEKLSEAFVSQGLYVETPVNPSMQKDNISPSSEFTPAKLTDVLHLTAAYQVTSEKRAMYLFREGVIVFWNMPTLERKNVLQFMQTYEKGSHDKSVILEEAETFIYAYTDTTTRFKSSQNLVLLNSEGQTELEKFTFSNALAMSVKLGIWEASLDKYIENIEYVTEELSKSGRVRLTQVQVLQRMGQLLALRHLINLSSDLLDTPDFYWDHEHLEQLYNKTANHLSIHKRTSVMNTKLSNCLELMEQLKSHLNECHSARLEWIIIILIMIEVFFEILHFL